MGSIITRAKKLRAYRFSVQIIALIALNLKFLNIWFPNMTLTGMQNICAPGFYCHGCPWATMACPLGVIVTFLRFGLFPVLAIATLALVGAFGGRFICGWICPFGWLQEVLYKIHTRKFIMPRQMRYLKYVILVVFVFAIPYLLPDKRASFCDICPSAVLESLIPYAIMGNWDVNSGLFGGFTALFWIKITITVGVLLFAVFVSRGFCRAFCPLGAIFAIFNKFSLFRYRLTFHKCNGCGACAKVCPVEIDPVKEINDPECVRCYECTNTKHIKMGTK